jgi:CDP-diacylglycerol pyrophosphatase
MRLLAVLSGAGLTITASVGQQNAAPEDPNTLWNRQAQCVADWQKEHTSTSCVRVELSAGVAGGYVVLKDTGGLAQFLLIPTIRLSGIEDPLLLTPGTTNYFSAAWEARTFVEHRLGKQLPRDSISLAVNSKIGRSQNQLHVHIDCVAPDIASQLRRLADSVGDTWMVMPERLSGHRYSAMRILGQALGSANPFVLAADGLPGARDAMGQHTLVLVGATFSGANPGFLLLDDRVDLAQHDDGHGEELQGDHSCAIAGR